MSVMIKGMKVPESCGKCKMHFIGHLNYVCCRITDRIPKVVDLFRNSKTDPDARIKSIEAVKRPYWCPLVEIPTPHGRLIDANEITAFVELERNGVSVESLDEFPTIIEEEGER